MTRDTIRHKIHRRYTCLYLCIYLPPHWLYLDLPSSQWHAYRTHFMVCRFCMEWFIILNISNSIDDKIEYCATQTYRLANEMRYVNQISQMAFNYPTNTFNTVTLRASSQINSPNFTNSHNIDRNWSDVSISDSSIILICLRSIFPVALHSVVAAVRCGERCERGRDSWQMVGGIRQCELLYFIEEIISFRRLIEIFIS